MPYTGISMNKIAQRRGVLDKLREKTNVSGKILEKFSPEYAELMDKLREVDDHIREEAMQLKDYIKAAKTNFNRREYMTSVFYLGKFHDRVESINHELSKLGGNVDDKHMEFLFGDMDPEHLEYLTKYFNPKVEKFKSNQNKKAVEEISRTVIKEAAFSDWWHNITTDRGKTLSGWEKRLPKYSKELKKQTASMITKSEAFLSFLLSSLKRLASFRNTRKLEDYLKEADKLKSKYSAFNVQFINYYNNNVKKMIDNKIKQLELSDAGEQEKPVLEEGVPSKPVENVRESFPVPVNEDPDTKKYPHMEPYEVSDPFKKSPSALETAKTILAPPSDVEQVVIPKAPKVPNIPVPTRRQTILPPSMEPELGRQDTIEGFSNVPSSISPALPSVKPHVAHTPTLTGLNPQLPPDRKTVPDLLKKAPPYGEVVSPQSGEMFSRPTLPSAKNAEDYQAFIEKLSSMEQEDNLVVAKEIILYANSCEDTEIKNKLLSIARNMIG